MKMKCAIAAIIVSLIPASAVGQQAKSKAPSRPAICQLYDQSLAQFAAVKNNAEAVAASAAHIQRMERRAPAPSRVKDIESLVAGSGWQRWIADARGDLAGEMAARHCG